MEMRKLKDWLEQKIWIDDGRKGATFNHWYIGHRWLLLSAIGVAAVVVVPIWRRWLL